MLNEMFNHMANLTYSHLQALDISHVDPDLSKLEGYLVDDFFGMITRYLRYLPQVVLCSPTLVDYVNCKELQMKLGIKCIGVKTVTAAKAVYQFWEEIFRVIGPENNLAGRDNLIKLLSGAYGLEVVKSIVQVLVNNFPQRVVCKFMDDVLINVITNLREQSVNWFIDSLREIPQSILNNGEKESFIMNLSAKPYEEHKDYYSEFFDKFYKRCKTHNSKIY